MKVGTDAMVLGALINAAYARTILDVGSGTGILALMCAQKNASAHIIGIEVDADASEECAGNFAQAPWSERLTSIHANFIDWQPTQTFDLVVSNPPYYQTGKFTEDERLRLAKHVGELTAECFFDKTRELLAPMGRCEIIVPARDEILWRDAAQDCGLYLVRRTQIFGKRNGESKRMVLVFQREEERCEEGTLTIRELNGNYTPEYIELTRDFHGVPL